MLLVATYLVLQALSIPGTLCINLLIGAKPQQPLSQSCLHEVCLLVITSSNQHGSPPVAAPVSVSLPAGSMYSFPQAFITVALVSTAVRHDMFKQKHV